jgi:hypothetical protein
MTIGLERILNRYIDGYYNANSRCYIYPQDTDDNYIAYLSIDVSDRTKIQCPLCVLLPVINELMRHQEGDHNLTEIVVPLQLGSRFFHDTIPVKTVDSALKALFENTEVGMIRKAILGDTCIYGTLGLIMDSEFEPYMMVTVEFNFDTKTFNNYTVTVSPDTYLNKDKISKGIVSRLIPYYLEKNVISNLHTGWNEANLDPIITLKSIDCYKTNYNWNMHGLQDPNSILYLNSHTLELSL